MTTPMTNNASVESIGLLNYSFSSAGVRAFSTQRAGGVSQGAYASMNVNPFCGDDPQRVAENRRRLASALDLPVQRIVLPHQTHQTKVRHVDVSYWRQAPEEQQRCLDGVDALTTNESGICIGISTADCVPILLFDPEHQAIGAVHAGWRGTVERIAEKVVCFMQQTYDTRPEELEAVIGPSISLESFEVGNEVYDAFRTSGFPMEAIATRKEKWHIDLWAANFLLLEQMGLQLQNIHVSGICTYQHADQYFSARRLGTQSGRIYTGIFLRPI